MKIFAVSDIHGFYDELINALNDVGFEKDNAEHLLVCCGDYFDRGKKNVRVMNYINSVSNKVLIKGNHESLILECIARGEALSHDYSNGTYKTIMEFGKYYLPYTPIFQEACIATEKHMKDFIGQMVDFYETKNYVFVHSWLPTNYEESFDAEHVRTKKHTIMEDWRNASAEKWEDARWGNPFSLAEQDTLPDRRIIFGHWHVSHGWARKNKTTEFGSDAIFDPFITEKYIGIDACTAYSKKVNVLVLEDDLLE